MTLFDRFGELTVPSEANRLFGSNILRDWLSHSDRFFEHEDPFQAILQCMQNYLLEYRATVSMNGMSATGEGIFIHESADILPGTMIEGPCVIGEGSVVGPVAYLRPGSVIGAYCRIGFCAEVKMSVVFDRATASHQTYIGHSIVGQGSIVGGGAMMAARRFDDRNVLVHTIEGPRTGHAPKYGSTIGMGARIGANASLMPGTLVMPGACVLPGTTVSGVVK